MGTRVLQPHEWDAFSELCKREFGKAPTPAEATVVVEEIGGEIVGFLCAGWVVVAGPCWVKQEHRHSMKILSMLIHKMQQITRARSAYVWTKNSKLQRLYRLMGLKDEGRALSWRQDE